MKQLRIPLPDDFHIHLRQGPQLENYVRDAAHQFGRLLVMPNLIPPITDALALRDYKRAIEAAAPGVEALMTFKLHANYQKEDLILLKKSGAVASKYYPAGVTTNSEDGIADFNSVLPVVAMMEELDLILCLHGEEPSAFCLDREESFLDKVDQLVHKFPRLRIILEHLSTEASVLAVRSWPDQVGATITVHHLVHTLDDLLGDGLQPHLFCKPLLKRPEDRAALRAAAFSGHPKFFLGTDSAPHDRSRKECPCGAAGVYSAPVAMPILVREFINAGALPQLTAFCAANGADFYRVPRTTRHLVLVNEPWTVPADKHGVVPMAAGEVLDWRVSHIE